MTAERLRPECIVCLLNNHLEHVSEGVSPLKGRRIRSLQDFSMQ